MLGPLLSSGKELDRESLDEVVAVFPALLVLPIVSLVGAFNIDAGPLHKIGMHTGLAPKLDTMPRGFLSDSSVLFSPLFRGGYGELSNGGLAHLPHFGLV